MNGNSERSYLAQPKNNWRELANAQRTVTPFVLSEHPAGTRAFPRGHYTVPDTNALFSGMDLFEHTGAFYDVIILQTVL